MSANNPKHGQVPDRPPAWAAKLLNWLTDPNTSEEVEGDLLELYAYWTKTAGKQKANWRYVLNAFKLLRPFARQKRSEEYPNTYLFSHDMIRNYLKIAFRTLALHKVYSAINVIGLSIGLAAAMLIMLYAKDEVSYDRFHTNNPNIYRITYSTFTPAGVLEGKHGNTGYLQGPRFTANVPEIESFVRYREHRNDIKQGTTVTSQAIFQTDPDFFSIFSFPLLSGNPKTALQDPRSVVLSEDMAMKYFGTTDALGKIVSMKDSYDENAKFEPYTVTGVARNNPQNSTIKFDVLSRLVVKQEEMDNNENWFNTNLNTFVLVRPDADIKATESKINRFYKADSKEAAEIAAKKYNFLDIRKYALQPFTDMHLSKELQADNGLRDGSNPMFSYILSGIAIFILLIACINFVNLTVARSLKRAKEIGVRKVVGGGRFQLIFQFLGESFVLCFASFVCAILLVIAVLPTFNQLANKALAISYLFDYKLVTGYILLFMTTGLLAGFYPAMVLSSYSPVQTLYNRFNLSGKNYLQKSLVVLQFAIASFLIVATITIQSQFNYLTNKSLGYEDKDVISIDKTNLTRAEYQVLKTELLKNPNILDVAPKNGGRWGTRAKVKGDKEIDFTYETVDASYLPLLKVPVVNGRNFAPDHPTDSTNAVLVNEAFVKKSGLKNPVGEMLDFWYRNEKYLIVGVVKDHHYAALNEEIGPQVFTMKPGNPYGKALIKIKPNSETASIHHIEKTFKKLFPIQPYEYKFLTEENRKNYESEAKWKQIMLFGAVLTIFISCIGLFGVATLSAERRRKEVGIRKVLGASVASIMGLLSSDFLKLVVVSFIISFPIALYAIGKWLENYPYRIEISAWTFLISALLAIMVAFLTVSFQSVRTALMNPVKSLRSE
jgi:ABC-type antimicrobial peptide transport system permease subunit